MSEQRQSVPLYRIRPAAVFHPLTRFYDVGCRLLGLGARFKRGVLGALDVVPELRILDVGCGTGVLLTEAAADTRDVSLFGADADPRALGIARRKKDRRRCRVSLLGARAEALPFRAAAFDRVVCTLAFHHVPDIAKEAALREMVRVLRPGGFLLLVDFDNRGRWWVPSHFRSQRALEAWFEIAGLHFRRLARGRMLHTFRVWTQPEGVPPGEGRE